MSKLIRGKKSSFAIGFILLIFLLGFQNCSRKLLFSVAHVEQANVDGNGGSYDGKPKAGAYLRYGLNGCLQAAAAKDLIGVMNVAGERAIISSDLCVAMKYVMDFFDSRFDFSFHNPDYIGVNSGTFEFHDGLTPPGKVEVWCRHRSGNFGLDVVVRSDLNSGAATGFLYTGKFLDTPTPVISPKQVIRVSRSTLGQVLSVTSPTVNLTAEVDLATGRGGVYAGQARLDLAGESLALQMSCRLESSDPALYSSPGNLLAIYQLEAGGLVEGSTLLDSGANQTHARLANADGLGVSYRSGEKSNAINLDDIDSYLDLSLLAPVAAGSDLSVSLWFLADASITDKATIFSINNLNAQNIFKVVTGGCSGSLDRERLTYEIGNTCYDSGAIVVDGRWHQVTVTLAAGQFSVYLDGVFVASQPATLSLSGTDNWSVGMDVDPSGLSDFWLGSIDEIVIWGRALSPGEISLLLR